MIACTLFMRTYKRHAIAASPVVYCCPYLCHMNQVTHTQAKTSGIDQKAIRASLKFETRFVTISEILMRIKKIIATMTKGKYQETYSLHFLSTTS